MPTPLGSLTLKLLLYRFFSLILSLTLTFSLWQSRSLSLQVSMLPSTIANEEADYKRREDLFTVMWVASIGCHMVEFFGVLFGTSLKSIQVRESNCPGMGIPCRNQKIKEPRGACTSVAAQPLAPHPFLTLYTRVLGKESSPHSCRWRWPLYATYINLTARRRQRLNLLCAPHFMRPIN